MCRSNRLAGLLQPMLWGYFPFLGCGALLLLALVGLLLATCWGTLIVPVILAAIIVGLPALHVAYAWSIVAAARRPPDELELRLPPGTRDKLMDFVEKIAEERECEPPDDIRVAADTVAHVYLDDRGKHVLVIGGLSIQGFSQDALAGVIAHELGHIAAGDTWLYRQAAKRAVTMALLDEQFRGSLLSKLNPFVWFAMGYHLLFRLSFAAYSRECEYAADRWEVAHVGKEQAAATTLRITVPDRLPYVRLMNVAQAAVETNEPLDRLFAEQARRIASIGKNEWREAMHKELEREPEAYDSHPTLKERLKAVKVSPKKALPLALAMDGPPARDLFPDWPQLEREMTQRLMGLLRDAHLSKREWAQIVVGRPI